MKRRKLKLLMMWSFADSPHRPFAGRLLHFLGRSCLHLNVKLFQCTPVAVRRLVSSILKTVQIAIRFVHTSLHSPQWSFILMPFTLIKHLLKYKHGVVGLVQLASICIRNQDACCCKLHVYLLPYRNFRRVTLIPL